MLLMGSTSTLSRVRPGVLLKSPLEPPEQPGIDLFRENVQLAFSVEVGILERLGSHPRIVRYLGTEGKGIVLGEASLGNLQAYIDTNNSTISLDQRRRWCRQALEAIVYIHSRGVVHADMRPENFLVHEPSSQGKGHLDLLLCDFGGGRCEELGLDGMHLPDGPFCDPVPGIEASTSTDIFSLGSVVFTIVTGHWPYRGPAEDFRSVDEMLAYHDRVTTLFREGKFPNVTGLIGEDVILGCWKNQFKSAQEALDSWDMAAEPFQE